SLAEALIENTYFGRPSRSTILSRFNASLKHLPGHYADLAKAIRVLGPGQVLVTDYPDLTRNQDGRVAEFLGPGDLPLISKADARLVSAKIIPALDAVIATAAQKYHWTLVRGVSADFRTHGYPSTAPWIRTLGESILMQSNEDGAFHPDA